MSHNSHRTDNRLTQIPNGWLLIMVSLIMYKNYNDEQ